MPSLAERALFLKDRVFGPPQFGRIRLWNEPGVQGYEREDVEAAIEAILRKKDFTTDDLMRFTRKLLLLLDVSAETRYHKGHLLTIKTGEKVSPNKEVSITADTSEYPLSGLELTLTTQNGSQVEKIHYAQGLEYEFRMGESTSYETYNLKSAEEKGILTDIANRALLSGRAGVSRLTEEHATRESRVTSLFLTMPETQQFCAGVYASYHQASSVSPN